MKASMNRSFFEQVSFDSGQPGGLGVVVHSFEEQGEFSLKFIQNEQVVDRVRLVVAEKLEESVHLSARLHVGLATKPFDPTRVAIIFREGRCEEAGTPRSFALAVGGHLVISTPQKTGYCAVLAEKHEDGEIFDTRKLASGDLFAAALVRPGVYSLVNTIINVQGEIVVAYPVMGSKPYRPPGPVEVTCTADGFFPSLIELTPVQGIVFRFQVPSRIKITLVEPNDGPSIPHVQERLSARKVPPSAAALWRSGAILEYAYDASLVLFLELAA